MTRVERNRRSAIQHTNHRKSRRLANAKTVTVALQKVAVRTMNNGLDPTRTTRSRFTPQPNAGMRLEERDRRLLADLFLHRLMSRSQIQALYFTSLPRCNARLRQLFDYGFLARFYPPVAPFGAQAIYSVGKAAVPVIATELEMDIPAVRRQLSRGKTPTFIEHTLAIVDVWLAFIIAAQEDQNIEIERWLPEAQCRHEYDLREAGGKWRKEVFKPDAFIRLENNTSRNDVHHDVDIEYSNFFIEVDLGHTSARQFEGKLIAHRRYLESGLFNEIYGGDSFKTLVVTTSERRLANLCELIRGQDSDLFWFMTFERAQKEGVFSAIWTRSESEGLSDLI